MSTQLALTGAGNGGVAPSTSAQEILFEDILQEGSDTLLESHSPSPTGDSWNIEQQETTGTTPTATVLEVTDTLENS